METQTQSPRPASDWHLKLFRKSLLKQAKLRAIVRVLGPTDGQTCLDLGADNGVISYHLRQRGGTWTSADLDAKAVESIRGLVGERVDLLSGPTLPYADQTFDAVVIVDMLEHVDQDYAFVQECFRVLKPNGRLIVNVPHIKKWASIPVLRRVLGLKGDTHGHVRPGYTETQLYDLVKDGFDVQEAHTYSRFFVEAMDTGIRFVAARHGGREAGAKGLMIDEQGFQRMEKMFKVYRMLYPVFWLAAQLDRLLFLTKGYCLVARAKRRRQWLPRRIPVLADGRSMAEATLTAKIGTAAPF